MQIINLIQAESALHEAVHHRDYLLIQELVQDGIEVNLRNSSEQTPLHVAAYRGDEHATELLIACGADVDAQDIELSTPLHYAARGNHRGVAELLVKAGAHVKALNAYYITPLYIASHFGALDMVSYLVEKGADINEADLYDATLMICAAEQNRVENVYTVELLHNLGAPINGADKAGNTALHATIHRGALGGLIALVALRANPTLADQKGRTPADLADEFGYHEIAAALRVYEKRYEQESNGEDMVIV